MIIGAIKHLEIATIGEDDGMEAGIDKSSLPFILEMLSTSFYSNPIGSVCREITSNCFDAHVEFGVEEPVIVRRTWDIENECYYIHFIDYGIGLSAERLVHTYMNWFSSTKRDTNDLIGGFGLGSKSPLSYNDIFYINSVHNGLEYDCMFHKGESLPKLESFNGWEERVEIFKVWNNDLKIEEEKEKKIKYPIGIPTNRRNGTEIKIAIKNLNDERSFKQNLREQLCYFDNVYFDDWDIDNKYKIFEGETFKYRNKDQYKIDEMHIVYGKVSYPIEWREIGIKPINIPVAVKFEIGELVVTPNRESLRYTDEVKVLVKARVEACLKELVSMYQLENPQVDDLATYLEVRNQRPHIAFDDSTKLYIPKEYGVNNETVYSPLPNVKIPKNPFFDYKVTARINGEIATDIYDDVTLGSLTRNNNIYFSTNRSFNKYKNAFINYGFIVVSKKESFKTYCDQLGLYYYNKHTRYGRQYDFTEDNRKKVPILGKAKLIKQYKDHIHSIVLSKTKSYQDIEITEEWIKEYNLENKLKSAAYQRKLEEKVIVKKNGSNYRDEVKVADLAKEHLIIYGFIEDKEKLRDIKTLLDARTTSYGKKYTSKGTNKKVNELRYVTINKKRVQKPIKHSFITVEIAKTNFKSIRDLTNTINVNDILQSKTRPDKRFEKMFRDFNTYIKLKGIYNPFGSLLEKTSKHWYKRLDKLEDFRLKFNGIPNSLRNLVEEIGDKYNLVDEDLLKEGEAVQEFLRKVVVLDYVTSNIPRKYLAEHFRFSKITKLNSGLYSTNEPMKVIYPEHTCAEPEECIIIEELKQEIIEEEFLNNLII